MVDVVKGAMMTYKSADDNLAGGVLTSSRGGLDSRFGRLECLLDATNGSPDLDCGLATAVLLLLRLLLRIDDGIKGLI